MQISNTLKRAIDNSAKFARSQFKDKLESEHLFFGILLEKTERSVRLLNDYGVNEITYKKAVLADVKIEKKVMPSSVSYSKEISNFFTSSVEICEKNGKRELNIDEILYFMVLHGSFKSTRILGDYFKLNIKKELYLSLTL